MTNKQYQKALKSKIEPTQELLDSVKRRVSPLELMDFMMRRYPTGSYKVNQSEGEVVLGGIGPFPTTGSLVIEFVSTKQGILEMPLGEGHKFMFFPIDWK